MMKRFVVSPKGEIFKVEGKIVKRQRKGGAIQSMFRSQLGEEYPLNWTHKTLTEPQQRQYDIMKKKLEIEQLEFELLKYPEDTEKIKGWMKQAKAELNELIAK
jgi:hypothetical protein